MGHNKKPFGGGIKGPKPTKPLGLPKLDELASRFFDTIFPPEKKSKNVKK